MIRVGVFVLSLLMLVACSESQEEEAGPAGEKMDVPKSIKSKMAGSGLKFRILKRGKGPKAVFGDSVTVHYKGALVKDSTVVWDTRKEGKPLSFLIGNQKVIRGLEEGVSVLAQGGVVQLWIPSYLAYGAKSKGKIPARSDLFVEMELVHLEKMIHEVKPEPFVTDGIEEKTTASGLKYYLIEESDNGDFPSMGQTAIVHYTGYLKGSERIFDSSLKKGYPAAFELRKGPLAPGFLEGLLLLRTGEKARFIIPSELAYGQKGRPGVIPPGADLIFDVELIALQ